MSRAETNALLDFLDDSLAGVEAGVLAARAELRLLRQRGIDTIHPDTLEALAFRVKDRAETAMGAAKRCSDALERDGGR